MSLSPSPMELYRRGSDADVMRLVQTNSANRAQLLAIWERHDDFCGCGFCELMADDWPEEFFRRGGWLREAIRRLQEWADEI